MIGWFGFLRSCEWVVVKPLTSSPAMPMTTWVGPEPGHLLGFLERDRAVVDHRGDVRDGPRLHVRETLALAPDAANRPVTGAIDVEDERLGELGADVERRAGGQGLLAVALPDPTPEGHQAPVASRARRSARASVESAPERSLALGHLRPTRRPGHRAPASPR